MADEDVIVAEGISKRFGPVVALEDVSMHLRKGEVLALVGDNGAGKSTLIKILAGFHTPDQGRIFLDGRPVQFRSPAEARQHGIETVYQDLALINDLSVYHNMFLGREKIRRILGLFTFNDDRRMKELTRAYLETLKIRIPSVDSLVGTLSGGQRQSIAVARAIYSSPRVLILDEPLAALGAKEARMVLELVRELKSRGDVSIILIVHNYHQVFEVCDRINLLRQGRVVLDTPTSATSVEELTRTVVAGYQAVESEDR